MSQLPLTAKYRPQCFADVAGQEAVKAILSRACHEDKIAPAYLFSGTRGVGKTTVARIMAKAVNCAQAPTAEPCNQCRHCLQITQGACVDVVEIDGASNRGIDDARRIKEDIGYAPMDSRYKVFIIDEAHMLTTPAFNALLKTLEEPPPNVTFILATTEPHKFPATIISRCQHFIFKRLVLSGLEAHLGKILDSESVPWSPAALRLIARRASGSVRDGMSLLSQVLALGKEQLTEEDVRSVLGLAGQEVMFRLMEAVRDQDAAGLSLLLREILDQGLDLGFFLRELTTTWRNLFLLHQAGDKGRSLLELSDDEIEQWQAWAAQFHLSQIHACWQLTLEGQRRVLTSVEPALALELLLLNLAYLPQLLSLEQLSRQAATCAPAASPGAPAGRATSAPRPARAPAPSPATVAAPAPATAPAQPRPSGPEPVSASAPEPRSARAHVPGGVGVSEHTSPAPARPRTAPLSPRTIETPSDRPDSGQPAPVVHPSEELEAVTTVSGGPGQLDAAAAGDAARALPKGLTPEFSSSPDASPAEPGHGDSVEASELVEAYSWDAARHAPDFSRAADDSERPAPQRYPDEFHEPQPDDLGVTAGSETLGAYAPPPEASSGGQAPDAGATQKAARGPRTWQGFQAFLETEAARPAPRGAMALKSCTGEIAGATLTLASPGAFQYDQLSNPMLLTWLQERAREYLGPEASVRLQPPASALRRERDAVEEAAAHPTVKRLQEEFDARMIPGSARIFSER